MKLTTSLETERHAAKELASKLSGTGVELEEAKQLVSNPWKVVFFVFKKPSYDSRISCYGKHKSKSRKYLMIRGFNKI